MSTKNLNECCVFIKVSDMTAFSEYDNELGYNACVCLDDGIVVSNDMKAQYELFVDSFEKYMHSQEE